MKTPNFVTVLSRVALATSGMVFGLCLPSSAAQLWNWSYSGGGSQGGSGTFTTNDGPSPYLITGITGTAEGASISSLLAPGSLFNNDNLLEPSSPQLSSGGFAWLDDMGANWNLLWDSVSSYQLSYWDYGGGTPGFLSDVSFTATLANEPPATTPEPSSLLGFITLGGLMLGGAVRGARK